VKILILNIENSKSQALLIWVLIKIISFLGFLILRAFIYSFLGFISLNQGKVELFKSNHDEKYFASLFILTINVVLAIDNLFAALNLKNVLRQASFIGIIALGPSFVILYGGVDLSVGSMFFMSGILISYIADKPLLMINLVLFIAGLVMRLTNCFPGRRTFYRYLCDPGWYEWGQCHYYFDSSRQQSDFGGAEAFMGFNRTINKAKYVEDLSETIIELKSGTLGNLTAYYFERGKGNHTKKIFGENGQRDVCLAR